MTLGLQNKKFSVVIPTYKRAEWLLALLQSLNSEKNVDEVICIDDDSPNKADKEKLITTEKWRFKLTYLIQDKAGPATARNRGFRIAQHEFIVFLDDDTLVSPGWGDHILSAFKDELIAGVTGKTLSFKKETISERFLWHQQHLHKHQFNSDGTLAYVCTANSAFRKSALLKCSGFTENIPIAAGDDMDLGFKLKKLGYQFGYSSDAIVFHRQRETLIELWKLFFISGRGAYLCAQNHKDLNMEHITRKKLFDPLKVIKTIFSVPKKMLSNIQQSDLTIFEAVLFPLLEIGNHILYQLGRLSEFFKMRRKQRR